MEGCVYIKEVGVCETYGNLGDQFIISNDLVKGAVKARFCSNHTVLLIPGKGPMAGVVVPRQPFDPPGQEVIDVRHFTSGEKLQVQSNLTRCVLGKQ